MDPATSTPNLPGTSYSFVQSNLAGSQYIEEQRSDYLGYYCTYKFNITQSSISSKCTIYYVNCFKGDVTSPLARSEVSSPVTSAYRGVNNPVQQVANLGVPFASPSGVFGNFFKLTNIIFQRVLLNFSIFIL